MIKRAALALLLLSACAPEAAPPKEPEAPVVETPAPPAVNADDAAKYKAATAGEITVASPVSGARVTSPLVAEGSAINTWFFEGQFMAELVVDGAVLAQGPATQSGDKNWTDPVPVGFKAELAFDVTKETNAELILSEDMPAFVDEANDIRGPARSVRVPVVLLPSAK